MKAVDDSLSVLEGLDNNFSLVDLIVGSSSSHEIEYKTACGNIHCIGLLKCKDYAVTVCEGTSDAISITHSHQISKEILIMLSGKSTVYFTETGKNSDADCITLDAGNSVTIDPGVPHNVIWEEAGKILAISVPADEGFPDE